MSNIKNRKEGGFTIIEVLIVLAIAGLIMLIVFLAVPALQRNSRNTQIKNDASNISGAISEFASNNNGAMPATTSSLVQSGSTVTIGETGTAKSVAKVNGGTTVNLVTTKPTTLAANNVSVAMRMDCNGTTSSRQAAVFYAVETSGGTTVLCAES